jgi:hypothetical protein
LPEGRQQGRDFSADGASELTTIGRVSHAPGETIRSRKDCRAVYLTNAIAGAAQNCGAAGSGRGCASVVVFETPADAREQSVGDSECTQCWEATRCT